MIAKPDFLMISTFNTSYCLEDNFNGETNIKGARFVIRDDRHNDDSHEWASPSGEILDKESDRGRLST